MIFCFRRDRMYDRIGEIKEKEVIDIDDEDDEIDVYSKNRDKEYVR